jgi:hypothetical protein
MNAGINRAKFASILFSIYIVMVFYVFGGGMMDSLVMFRTWRYIGEDEFPRFHQSDNAHIIPVFVVFFFLSFIPQIMLFWYRPEVIPRWMVSLALSLNLIMLISSISIQIPIQIELDKKFSLALINRLIDSDFSLRVVPMVLQAVVNFCMLFLVVSNRADPQSPVSYPPSQ